MASKWEKIIFSGSQTWVKFSDLTKSEAENRLLDIAEHCLDIIAQPVGNVQFEDQCLAVITLSIISEAQTRLFSLVQKWPDHSALPESKD